jgi:hypothetical protein
LDPFFLAGADHHAAPELPDVTSSRWMR